MADRRGKDVVKDKKRDYTKEIKEAKPNVLPEPELKTSDFPSPDTPQQCSWCKKWVAVTMPVYAGTGHDNVMAMICGHCEPPKNIKGKLVKGF